MADIVVTGIREVLGVTTIGFIPAIVVGAIVAIILVILLTRFDKNKAILGVAPMLYLVSALGFTIHVVFLIVATLAFVIYLFVDATYTETVTEG